MRIIAFPFLIIAFLTIAVPRSYAAVDTYTWELRKNSHRGQAYDAETWDAKVIWFATFFSDDFRRSFDKKHAKINHMGPLESAKWFEEEQYRQGKQWEFFVSFYTKKDYKKFSLDPDSFWKIFMTTGQGEVVHPIAVEQISITPYEKIMFHHINRWSKAYRVIFPKVEIGNLIQLTLQSIVGQSNLVWNLSHPSSEAQITKQTEGTKRRAKD